jgi:plasmid stabilization system protein ParE
MMLRFTQSAKNDLQETLAFIDGQGAKRGTKFRGELRRCIAQIKASPDSWPRVFLGVRMRIMRLFKFGIYYQILEKMILVGAVVHLKRNTRFLRKRFKKS